MVNLLRQLAARLAAAGTAALRGWNQFWFRPADPTGLGVMRIGCGLVALYIHLSYGAYLQEFCGKHAWLDLDGATMMRRETPNVPPQADFEGSESSQEQQEKMERQAEALGPPVDPAEQAFVVEYRKRWGVDPRQSVGLGYPAWSIWYYVTNPSWMAVVQVAIVAIFVLFTFGFATRVTSVLAWLAAMSYIQRSPTSLFGQDTILSILLFYLMIGPSGAALSLDRLIARYWTTYRALRKRQPIPPLAAPAPSVSANFTLRLAQVHFCIIYLASGMSKMQGAAWWDGTAIWQTMANYEFALPKFAIYTNLLRFLTEHRWLLEIGMTGGALFTLVEEIGFTFLVWNRHFRWPFIIGSLLLHVGIATMMGLTCFSLLMMTLVLCFVPAATWHWLLGLLGRNTSRLRLEADSRGRARAVACVRACDPWNQVAAVEPAGSNGRLELRNEQGEVLTGYPLAERLVRTLRLLQPLAVVTWIPGVSLLGRKLFPGTFGTGGGTGRPHTDAGVSPRRRRGAEVRA
jgi:hypothetical protein